ncbi:hypothetical protein ANCDUO_07675 [Ancylostoma duodenale]|uniref:Uncharacterized protein n=1 Tax=Ancylostoma duodenale TaxID=51022 RepID=A0A0C2GLD7_9BILA|nr:hypothetical protein ANCDUO_07675 [Ancylostoma duodenale]
MLEGDDGERHMATITYEKIKTRDQDLITEESEIYGDILQADYIDAYRNITYKKRMGHRTRVLQRKVVREEQQ